MRIVDTEALLSRNSLRNLKQIPLPEREEETSDTEGTEDRRPVPDRSEITLSEIPEEEMVEVRPGDPDRTGTVEEVRLSVHEEEEGPEGTPMLIRTDSVREEGREDY